MSKLRPTLADYLVIAVSPAMIMTLIGSLVFFLIDLFYQGQYVERLHFIFALFVMASVLVGRIAIEMGSGHATMYAGPLAVVTFLALQRLVQIPGDMAAYTMFVNAGLVGLILWCSQKLTWNCTFIDESLEESGEGVLRTMGLDPPRAKQRLAASGASGDQAAPTRSDQPRPHSGGIWVVYFSLAALPLFGIGQRFLPPADLDRRRYAFLLLCVYVASALGLLMTTSFLGLRRYLRRRRLQMPAAMAGVWVATGCLLIAAILGFAAMLPRPNPEYALAEVPWKLSSEKRSASRHAVGKEGAEISRKGDAASDARPPDAIKQQASGQPLQQPDASPRQDSSQGGQRKPPTVGGPIPPGDAASDHGRHREPKVSSEAEGRAPSQSEEQGKSSAVGGGEKPFQKQKRETSSGGQKTAQGQESGSQDETKAQQSEKNAPPQTQSKTAPPATPRRWSSWSFSLGEMLKWLFYLVLFCFVAYVVWRSRAVMVQAVREFWQSLRAFWAALFGSKGDGRQTAADVSASEAPSAPPAFASFADPFAAGWAERWTPDELVRYSFSALEAWAREHGCPRAAEQTPHEFAERIGDRVPRLRSPSLTMAKLYCQVAYAGGQLPVSIVASLREFWQQLTSA